MKIARKQRVTHTYRHMQAPEHVSEDWVTEEAAAETEGKDQQQGAGGRGGAHPSCSMTSGAMKHGVPTNVCLSR